MIEYDIFICVALAIPSTPFNVSSGAVATGKEDVQIMCNPRLSVISEDTFQVLHKDYRRQQHSVEGQ